VKALVTGAPGFLGSHLSAELRRRGDEIVALVRPSSSSTAELEGQGVSVVRADLRRPPADLAERLGEVDVIYHCAAGVQGSWRATFDNNVTATENLLEAIRKDAWKGRLVHVSSFSVYGFNQLPKGAQVDESTPLEPQPGRRDDYAWSKLLQERAVTRLRDEGFDVVIVRPGAIYGRERRFQYRLGRPLGEGTVILIGGLVPMPLNYVENTASLLAECGRHPAAAGQTFNAVDPEPPTQLRYLREWHSRAGPLKVIPFPLTIFMAIGSALRAAEARTAGGVEPPVFLDPYVMGPSFRRFRYDTSRAESLLGWRPPVSRAAAFDRTFGPRRA
jgi:2-alkyl-3-oxoalkanoate reductase